MTGQTAARSARLLETSRPVPGSTLPSTGSRSWSREIASRVSSGIESSNFRKLSADRAVSASKAGKRSDNRSTIAARRRSSSSRIAIQHRSDMLWSIPENDRDFSSPVSDSRQDLRSTSIRRKEPHRPRRDQTARFLHRINDGDQSFTILTLKSSREIGHVHDHTILDGHVTGVKNGGRSSKDSRMLVWAIR